MYQNSNSHQSKQFVVLYALRQHATLALHSNQLDALIHRRHHGWMPLLVARIYANGWSLMHTHLIKSVQTFFLVRQNENQIIQLIYWCMCSARREKRRGKMRLPSTDNDSNWLFLFRPFISNYSLYWCCCCCWRYCRGAGVVAGANDVPFALHIGARRSHTISFQIPFRARRLTQIDRVVRWSGRTFRQTMRVLATQQRKKIVRSESGK